MKTEDIQRAIAGGNKVLAEALKEVTELKQDIARVCPIPKKKRIRQSAKPLMNKLESEFFDYRHVIDPLPILIPQSIRFKLGNGIWYKPDFVDCSQALLTCYEVKGPHSFRGGFENLKVAAHQYPWIKWVLAWKEGSEWVEQVVLP